MMSVLRRKSPIEILVVDDNCGDTELLHEAFIKSDAPLHVHCVHDGTEALDYLYHRPPYTHAHTPDLILLDINMPRMNGVEVLSVIKNDPTLQHIPVLMLTSSCASSDVAVSYHHHANAYLVKPDTLEGIGQLARHVEAFWMYTARLATSPFLSEHSAKRH